MTLSLFYPRSSTGIHPHDMERHLLEEIPHRMIRLRSTENRVPMFKIVVRSSIVRNAVFSWVSEGTGIERFKPLEKMLFG